MPLSKKAEDLAEIIFAESAVPFLVGKTGTGKTSVIGEIAREYGYELVCINLASYLPEDLGGIPVAPNVNNEDKSEIVLLRKAFSGPLYEALEKGKDKKMILFFDEIDRASEATLNACLKLLLERKLDNITLSPNVLLVAAGNLHTDNVNILSKAARDRFKFIDYSLNIDEWIDYQKKNNFTFSYKGKNYSAPHLNEIISFVVNNPSFFYKEYDPELEPLHNIVTPRKWTRLNAEIYSRFLHRGLIKKEENENGVIEITQEDLNKIPFEERRRVFVLDSVYQHLPKEVRNKISLFMNEYYSIKLEDILSSYKENEKLREKVKKTEKYMIAYLTVELENIMKEKPLSKKEMANIVNFISDLRFEDNKAALVFAFLNYASEHKKTSENSLNDKRAQALFLREELKRLKDKETLSLVEKTADVLIKALKFSDDYNKTATKGKNMSF